MNAIVYGGLARGQVTRISDASTLEARTDKVRAGDSLGSNSAFGGACDSVGKNEAEGASDVLALKQRLAQLTQQLADEVARLPAQHLLAEGQAAAQDGSSPASPTPDELRGQLRREIKARRLRERLFPEGLFADPAWDILLDLTLARLEGRQTPVSSLCIAAAVPTTTALRWIKTLLDRELIERRPDPDDRRRHYIHVSEAAFAMMMQLLGRRIEPGRLAG